MSVAIRLCRIPARCEAATQGFEVRFETSPGGQAQVDFARFHVIFTDEPTTPRNVWLFSMVLGYSRLIWAALSCTRTCRPSFVAMRPLSKRLVVHRGRSFMIG